MNTALPSRNFLRDNSLRRFTVIGGAVVAASVLAIALARTMSDSLVVVFAAPIVLAVAVAMAVVGLRHPLVALGYFLVALFLRLALPQVLPVDAFQPAFVGLVISCVIWLWRNTDHIPRPGAAEYAMIAYFIWNIISIVTPHHYGAVTYIPDSVPLDLTRMVLTAVVMPFTLYYLGRVLGASSRRADAVAWMVVAFGAYSTLVSILQFHAPALVWPRYIVDSPNWVGRANGVPNQPSVNGIIVLVGMVTAMYLASRPGRSAARRTLLALLIAASAYAVFLTHTRIIYVALVLVLLVGAIIARGFRRGFVIAGSIGIVVVGANWSTFASSDRSKGGVGSTSEVLDRLNAAATSLWAFDQKPILGWGLGRFVAIDTLQHRQWSPDVPFERGLGIASHFNELGILVELGLVGLVAWLAVLLALMARLWPALRAPVDDGGVWADIDVRGPAVCGALALLVMMTVGTSDDLRLFDVPTVLVMMVIGVAVGRFDAARADAVAAAATTVVAEAPSQTVGLRS